MIQCTAHYWHTQMYCGGPVADRLTDFIDRLTDLFMDLLEEGDLLLQTLNASLQVQPGQSGIVDILDTDA